MLDYSCWEHLLISNCVKCEWQQCHWLALSLGISHHNRSITLEPLCKQSVLKWRRHLKMIALHKQNATLLFLPCCPPSSSLHSSLNSLILSFLPSFPSPLSKFSSVPMPVKDIWPVLNLEWQILPYSRHQTAISVFASYQMLWGADQWRTGKERMCLNTSWKEGLSGHSGEREEKNLKSEVERGVIKIHPTVQTKGGMKKGENAGEKQGWVLGG